MACVYAPIEENRTAAEVVAGYRAVRSRLWAKPKAPVVPIAVIPAKATTTVKQERDFMLRAHKVIETVAQIPTDIKATIYLTSEILAACAQAGNVTVDEIKSARRVKNVMAARLAYYYIARNNTKASFPTIGRLVGGRDHSTVLSGVNRAERAIREKELPITRIIDAAFDILEGVE